LAKEQELKTKVKSVFDKSDGEFGANKICGILRKSQQKCSFKIVSGVMKDMKLSSKHNRRKNRSLTDSKKSRGDGFPNLVRDLLIIRPLQAVCSDITYIRSGEGWVYACVIKDICTGIILGQASSDRMKKELVIKAFLNANSRYHFKEGLIFHSDRGSQYTSKEFMDLLKMLKIKQSFSRVACPGDNAWAESFFATLKKCKIHFEFYPTRESVQFMMFEWIETVYNTYRVQARLGYLSPKSYAETLKAKTESLAKVS